MTKETPLISRNWFGIRTNIRRRIVITFGFLTVISLLILSALQGVNSYITFQQKNYQYQSVLTESAALQVQYYINGIRQNLETLSVLGDGDLYLISQSSQLLFTQTPPLLEVIAVDLQGTVIGGAARGEVILRNLFTVKQSEWFIQSTSGETYLSTMQISSTNQPYVIMALPIYNNSAIQGVLAARVDMYAIWEVVANIKVGEQGQAYIVTQNGVLVAHKNTTMVLEGKNLSQNPDFYRLLSSPPGTILQFTGLAGKSAILTTALIEGTDFVLVAELPVSEAYAPYRNAALLLFSVMAGVFLIAVFGSRLLARQITRPLQNLAVTAEQVRTGDLTARADVQTADEIGLLASVFNQVVEQLDATLKGLEARISARTRALEAGLVVSRRLSTILDEHELMNAVVEELENSFQYYHVHIYLFDDTKSTLVMESGTGEVGQKLLERGHAIPRGKGLVGRAADSGAAVLVSDTSSEPQWLPNPLLPDTKSEVAVPIAISDTVIGVLDVQQNTIGGLGQLDADLLQSIANQLAVALQNARAYDQATKQADKESLLASIGENIRATISIDEALKVAVREAGRATGSRAAIVRLNADLALEKGERGTDHEE